MSPPVPAALTPAPIVTPIVTPLPAAKTSSKAKPKVRPAAARKSSCVYTQVQTNKGSQYVRPI
jgi:hypothetical protein